jgi:hypothetical protein
VFESVFDIYGGTTIPGSAGETVVPTFGTSISRTEASDGGGVNGWSGTEATEAVVVPTEAILTGGAWSTSGMGARIIGVDSCAPGTDSTAAGAEMSDAGYASVIVLPGSSETAAMSAGLVAVVSALLTGS